METPGAQSVPDVTDSGERPAAHAYAIIAAMQHGFWRMGAGLSSLARQAEHFLERAGFERAPWLAVAYGSGIAAWVVLANRWEWLGLVSGCFACALAAWVLLRDDGAVPYLRQALMAVSLMVAAGCLTVWAKSSLVGTPPIAHAMVPEITGRVLDRYAQPAQGRARLIVAIREPRTGRPIRVRLTLPQAKDRPGLDEGALVRLRAQLMPPTPPRLPGSYDFARAAWFAGMSATGRVLGAPQVVVPAPGGHWLARLQHWLSAHVRSHLGGSPGGIAAAFASGDRGGISAEDDQAMRDAGLTHLLSVSGLHVSAVVGGAYLLTLRLLALFPAVALRLRLPLVAAGAGGLAGIGYTLLTGAEVPTVRSCLGALLVLAALALGRQPLSLRLLATAALAVMLLWPESVVGPSFQMSFGSVIAIIALHNSAPAQAFLAPRAEPWLVRMGRHLFMILLTGMVIDLALMPIALFHFHRAGIYGSMANVIAIPLTTFVSMPLIALALALDTVGLGAPAWWLTGKSLALLLALAHWTAAQPGAVTLLPAMGAGSFGLFVAAMLWLALWKGRARLLGLVPALAATAALGTLRPPDLLITGDGKNLGILTDGADKLLVLREGRSSFTRDSMLELAGMAGGVAPLNTWPGARCNHDYCLVELARGGRTWRILVARNQAMVAYGDQARGCAGVDIVIAPHKLFGPCRPALLKADRVLLMRTGGIALDLVNRRVATVEDWEGEHPWWRAPHRLPRHSEDDDWPADPPPDPPAATIAAPAANPPAATATRP